MKKYRKHYYQLIVGLFIIMAAFTSCEEKDTLGIEVLPTDDLISVKNVVIQDAISAYTYSEDSVLTNRRAKSMLGNFNDPVFGKSTIDFASQFRLQAYPDFGENPVADSVKLVIRYRTFYGDTTTIQRFKVYELESSLQRDGVYYQDIDLKSHASSQLLGEIDYRPVLTMDSTETDTFQQIFSIPIDVSLGEKLVNADSALLVNNDSLLTYFKGLYIETESLNSEGGAVLSLDAISSSSKLGTGLVVYYNNDENKAAATPDTMFVPFLISNLSARVNRIEHDYSNTTFFDRLNSEDSEDSLLYIQSTGGLKSKILIDNLLSWQDSVNIGINKAELIFQVDSIASDVENYPPPSRLLFTVIDEKGVERLPVDYYFNSSYYGGELREDLTYHFNITQHLQRIIEKDAGNFGFFLTPANKESEANRVVLKGSSSETGIKLVITYSKFNI